MVHVGNRTLHTFDSAITASSRKSFNSGDRRFEQEKSSVTLESGGNRKQSLLRRVGRALNPLKSCTNPSKSAETAHNKNAQHPPQRGRHQPSLKDIDWDVANEARNANPIHRAGSEPDIVTKSATKNKVLSRYEQNEEQGIISSFLESDLKNLTLVNTVHLRQAAVDLHKYTYQSVLKILKANPTVKGSQERIRETERKLNILNNPTISSEKTEERGQLESAIRQVTLKFDKIIKALISNDRPLNVIKKAMKKAVEDTVKDQRGGLLVGITQNTIKRLSAGDSTKYANMIQDLQNAIQPKEEVAKFVRRAGVYLIPTGNNANPARSVSSASDVTEEILSLLNQAVQKEQQPKALNGENKKFIEWGPQTQEHLAVRALENIPTRQLLDPTNGKTYNVAKELTDHFAALYPNASKPVPIASKFQKIIRALMSENVSLNEVKEALKSATEKVLEKAKQGDDPFAEITKHTINELCKNTPRRHEGIIRELEAKVYPERRALGTDEQVNLRQQEITLTESVNSWPSLPPLRPEEFSASEGCAPESKETYKPGSRPSGQRRPNNAGAVETPSAIQASRAQRPCSPPAEADLVTIAKRPSTKTAAPEGAKKNEVFEAPNGERLDEYRAPDLASVTGHLPQTNAPSMLQQIKGVSKKGLATVPEEAELNEPVTVSILKPKPTTYPPEAVYPAEYDTIKRQIFLQSQLIRQITRKLSDKIKTGLNISAQQIDPLIQNISEIIERKIYDKEIQKESQAQLKEMQKDILDKTDKLINALQSRQENDPQIIMRAFKGVLFPLTEENPSDDLDKVFTILKPETQDDMALAIEAMQNIASRRPASNLSLT